jgi:serine phosphatase RsbU (regulator of sigma subunit)/tetratricopeptide (TPR) repeat protein
MNRKKYILVILISIITSISYCQNNIEQYLSLSEKWLNKNLDSSTYYTQIAYRLASEKKDSVLITICAINLSRCFEYTGQYQRALYYAKSALNIAEKINNDSLLFNAYSSCGIQNEYLGNYSKADYYYDKSLLYAYKLKSLNKISSVFNNKGLLNYTIGNFQKAYSYFNKHLMLSSINKNLINVSIAYNNMALLFQALGNKKIALNYYYKTLSLDSRTKNERYYSATLNNIASVYIDLKMYDSALYYIRKSLGYKLKINDKYGEMLCYQNLGVIYFNTQNYDSCEFYLLNALKLNKKIKDYVSNIETKNSLGMLYHDLKKYNYALKYLKEAENYLVNNNYHKSNEIYKNLYKLYESINDFRNAYKYLNLYVLAQDSLYKNESLKKIQEKELLQEIERQKYLNKIEQEYHENILKEREEKSFFINLIVITAAAGLLIFGVLMYRNYIIKKKANDILIEKNETITKQNFEITLQNKIIEEKNKDITDSIHYAKRIQDAMLPDETYFKNIFGDNYFILFLPKDIVSGDFYWLLQNDNGILLAVADCTGHGVPGGFMSIVANNALNRCIKEFRLTKPNEILEKVNYLIEEILNNKNNNYDLRDGMDISLCLIKNENNNKFLYYSGANRPVWLVRNNTLTEINGDKQPIGRYENRKPFSFQKIALEKNDQIYLSSDGYTDQFGGDEIKKFKTANFKKLLTVVCNKNMNEQKNIILQTHRLWKNEQEQIDDICVIGIKI